MAESHISESDRVPAAPLRVAGRRHVLTQVASALALVIPVALLAYRNAVLVQTVTLRELFVAPMLAGSALTFWMLYLHLFVCGDDIHVFGLGRPRPGLDVLIGAGLAAGLLVFQVTSDPVLARLLPPRPAVPQVLTLIAAVSRDPWLLALWLGPVVWVGVALFEELTRVFLLRRVWLIRPGAGGRWTAILLVAALVGLVHAYQGSAAIVSVGVQSVLLGWVYFRSGRVRVLVAAHALYDSAQIVMAVVTIRQMGY